MLLNIHPLINSFPLCLVMLIICFELIAIYKPKLISDQTLVILNVLFILSVLLSFLTGYLASDQASQSFVVPKNPIENHFNLAKILLFAFIPYLLMFFLKKHNQTCRWIYYLSLLAIALLIIYLSALGGDLVYDYGAGVKLQNL